MTYCCLGNSTKCSSSSSRPHLSLLPLPLSLPAPFLHIFVVLFFSFTPRGLLLTGVLSVRTVILSVSRAPHWRGTRSSIRTRSSRVRATSLVFEFAGKFVSRSQFEVISSSAHTYATRFLPPFLSVRISYSFRLRSWNSPFQLEKLTARETTLKAFR